MCISLVYVKSYKCHKWGKGKVAKSWVAQWWRWQWQVKDMDRSLQEVLVELDLRGWVRYSR